MFLKILIESQFEFETISVFLEYMNHREYNGEKMTTFSMKATISKLKKDSAGNEDEIRKLMLESVGNGYKGLFKTKTEVKAGNNSDKGYVPLTADDLKGWET